MINPCQNCPESLLYSAASRELDYLKAGCSRAQQEIDTPSTSRKRRRYLADWIASMGRSLIPLQENLLPEGGEQSVNDCAAPFERTISERSDDGIDRQYRERICGARVANHVTSMLIEPVES